MVVDAVQCLPAPPATHVCTPEVKEVKAKEPATPPDPVIVVPESMGRLPITPELTLVALGVASPAI